MRKGFQIVLLKDWYRKFISQFYTETLAKFYCMELIELNASLNLIFFFSYTAYTMQSWIL